MYVADAHNNRISVFDAQGSFLRAFGKDVVPSNDETGIEVCTNRCQAGPEGAHGGELSEPAGVAIDAAGLVHVTDFRNHRVLTYTANGTWLRAIGRRVNRDLGGTPNVCVKRMACKPGEHSDDGGALRGPSWVAIDAAGNVYVTEARSPVSVFSAQGAFVRAFGSDGEDAGEPSMPSGIASDGRGNLYVGEALNNRVSVFTTGGAFVQAFGRDVVPGNAETGFEACTAQCQAGALGQGPGQFRIPLGIALDCRGAVYVADKLNDRVQRLGAPGTASPPCPAQPAPATPFGIASAQADATNGTAQVVVTLPRAGTLAIAGPLIKPASKDVHNAGTAQLTVRPTPDTARRLVEHGSLPVRVTVTYTGSGAAPRTKVRDIDLRREPAS